MRKVILSVLALTLLVMAPTVGFSQTWHPTNQVTVAWDAVVLPAGATGSVAYDVYTVGEAAEKSTAVKVGRTTTTQMTIAFAVEGKYFIGAKSVRVLNGQDVSVSTIAWSDSPAAVSNGATFGVVYYAAPPAVTGLRKPEE